MYVSPLALGQDKLTGVAEFQLLSADFGGAAPW
jgi:hypothetical protein